MRYKGSLLWLLAILMPLIFITISCKKRKAFKEENGQAAEDVRRFQSRTDEAINDVNVAIMEQPLLRGKSANENSITTELCGLEIDTTNIYTGVTRLIYNGKSCHGIIKSGEIIVSIQDYPLRKWKQKNCVLKLEFKAYKVIDMNGTSIQIDGFETLINESANTYYDLRYLNASKLVQKHEATDLKITINASSTALFNISRRLTFTYMNESTICEMTGLASTNGVTNVSNWGQNRDGKIFSTEVLTPVKWKSSCNNGSSPISGEVSVKLEDKGFDLKCLFGVDESGEEVSLESTCAYGWKVSWSYKKKTNSRVFAYN